MAPGLVPPYVDGLSQSGDVRFLDIDNNRFVLAGAQYSPGILAGLSMRPPKEANPR